MDKYNSFIHANNLGICFIELVLPIHALKNYDICVSFCGSSSIPFKISNKCIPTYA